MKRSSRACLCRYCINELTSRGEKIKVSAMPIWTLEEVEQIGFVCEFCDEVDDLYEVEF